MNRAGLADPFAIGSVEVPNRVLLAPLAGIGNWFVRLQARRHGAGLAISEMVSSYAVAHGNRRTLEEMLRIDPAEHPVAVQLFGPDPEVMRRAAATAASAGADLIDLNMGCPVPKVCKAGAGAALLADPDRAVAVARAAAEGSGLPVTAKLRSGLDPGDRSGVALAVRLVEEAGVAGIGFHPRPASVHHKGRPDYALVRELVAQVDVPVILSGGLRNAPAARRAQLESRADAVMIARGALGYPWIFGELTGTRTRPPEPLEVIAELEGVIADAELHWGEQRAGRNLRKFYPWYLGRIGVTGQAAHAFQRTDDLGRVREMLAELEPPTDEVRVARDLYGEADADAGPAPDARFAGPLGRRTASL